MEVQNSAPPKKTKKNRLKQQYGNFKAGGSETLEQTFNRLQAIVSHLEFMDVPIEQDDLNQKLLTSLAPEWLVGKSEVPTVQGDSTASAHVPTVSTDVAAANLSYDTVFEEDKASKNHALVADKEEVPTKYALMAKSSSSSDNELGKDFVMQNKACYNCGSFDHLEFNCNHDAWVDKGKNWTRVNHAQDNTKYTSTHKSMTPRAVLLKSGTKPINRPFSTDRPTLKSAQPKMTSFVKTTHSNVKRPFERKSTAKNIVWSPTVRPKILTAGSKVPTAKPTVVTDKGNKGKAVKASASWIWKPKQTSFDQGSNFNGVSVTFKKYQYIDTQGRLNGCSRHMTGNISYLSEYDPFNGGYVSFGYGSGKITGKGSINTSKLYSEQMTHEFMHIYLASASVCVWIG
nr:putative ribonuclease H-like domain-containing protein [Tanacetum cinerariifolium]